MPRHHVVPLGAAAVRRRGRHLTIEATSVMVARSLAAAEELAAEGIDVTVVRPRTVKPLEEATILTEVAATERALLVQEAARTGGLLAEASARIAKSDAFRDLRAPIARLCGFDLAMPYAPALRKASVRRVADIVAGVRRLAKES